MDTAGEAEMVTRGTVLVGPNGGLLLATVVMATVKAQETISPATGGPDCLVHGPCSHDMTLPGAHQEAAATPTRTNDRRQNQLRLRPAE